jgi:glyceraldehyde-3-phosphate dehydrogenase/erythrose-4-phosphate dehydrogenase
MERHQQMRGRKETPVVVALIPTGMGIVLVVVIVVALRKLTKTKNVMMVTQRASVRDKARADASEREAERITGIATDAVAQTGAALDVAKEIHAVHGKVDVLMLRAR